MNDNNAAQAATPSVLTEAERRQLLVRANYPPLQEEPRAYLVKITEELVLSKLRAPVASAEVMDALNWVDDFIARCNRDDRGSCESVNVLRRALASAPVAQQAALSAQSATKDDKAALGLPECGKPLCAPGEHHPLCRHGWAEKKAASAPVAGDGKTRVPGDQLGGPAVAWDDGAQSDPNRPESRASIESKGGALAPVAGEVVAWEIPNPHLGSELTSHKARADEARRLGLTVHELFRHAAPQASEAVRGQDAGDVVAVLVYRSKGRPGAHGQTLGANGAGEFAVVYRGDEFAALVKANEEIRALEAAGHRLDFAAIIHGEGYSGPMLRQKYVTRAALSAQPADKPAISSPSSAGNPCPAPVPAYPETGNSHTDGGAVYG